MPLYKADWPLPLLSMQPTWHPRVTGCDLSWHHFETTIMFSPVLCIATVQHCSTRRPVRLYFSASLSQSLVGESFWNNNCRFLWKWNDFAVSCKICLLMSYANKIATARWITHVKMFVLTEYGIFYKIFCESPSYLPYWGTG